MAAPDVILPTPRAWDMMSSVAEFRKLGGDASLTEKIYASSQNQNCIHTTVSLSNHLPSNKSTAFNAIYEKWQKKLALPYFKLAYFLNVHKIHWYGIKLIPDSIISRYVNIAAMPIITYSKISSLFFPTSHTPKTKLFHASYPITENEFGHTEGEVR